MFGYPKIFINKLFGEHIQIIGTGMRPKYLNNFHIFSACRAQIYRREREMEKNKMLLLLAVATA